eukprot:COSAG04_NODE_85_length_27560_cov_8.621245_5_plen_103_part_00
MGVDSQDAELGRVYVIWRIDDGPVYGIPWDACQDFMQRSQWSVEQGHAPSWHSQEPSSCANESYFSHTTHSTTEMLTPGEHTLWHGVGTMSSHAVAYSGWIK